MAFGFGVGDILQLTKIVVTTIENISKAPAELQELAERIESVELNLQSINKLPPNAAGPNPQDLSKLVKRIKDPLGKIRDAVIKYRDTKGVEYAIFKKGGVGELVDKLEQRTHDLTDFLVIQIALDTNRMRPQIDKILKTVRQDQEHRNAAPRPDPKGDIKNSTLVSNQIDLVQSILERVLHPNQPGNTVLPAGSDDLSLEREIEVQLEQAGIDATFTKALIDVLNVQRSQFAHPEDIDPISVEVRSIIAHAYLEMVRVWTANYNGEWLFNRVESAGVQVKSKFAQRAWKSHSKSLVTSGHPPEKAALKAIAGKDSYFRSEEKNEILARITRHRSRGIDPWHFRKYEYMLCFDKSVYDTLMMFAAFCKERHGDSPSYTNLSQIILVRDIKLNTAAADLSANELSSLRDNITDGVKSFLRKNLGWKRPPLSISDGPYRTTQVVLSTADIKLNPDEMEAKLREIPNQIALRTDCRIRVTDERFPDGHLFSITGRKEALPFATSLLKEALL
ncbi:MAG: hypothetical protein Q9219_005410 [cf. Caloplaca sp. 3 TL-2023]